MVRSDLFVIVQWWGALFLIGAAAFPVSSMLFRSWHDRGYFFSKAVGLALVGWIVYILGTARLVSFSVPSIISATGAVFGIGVLFQVLKASKSLKELRWKTVFIEELFFFAALLFWSWVKAHEPSIRGLEKFMDYGFMNSILHSSVFPPADMWYPPYPINYYYFGHLVTAILTRISGLDLAYTFNLMLATLFALCFTMSYSIGYQLSAISRQPSKSLKSESRRLSAVLSGLLTAFLVTLAGNMQTIYAFTKGYSGDNVQPFWELWWNLGELWAVGGIGGVWGKIGEGMNTYWYANATRFIPFSIHEFPGYSFVVSDVHGHVLSIPFVLLAVALLVEMWGGKPSFAEASAGKGDWGAYVFYGFLCGVLLMTNALDGPIYAGLFMLLFAFTNWSRLYKWSIWRIPLVVGIAALFSSLPFLMHFSSFVNGVALNCPPASLAQSRVGPLLFETVDKCQRSPFWMLWLLWGFFWFCQTAFIVSRIWGVRKLGDIRGVWSKKITQTEKALFVFFCFSVFLIIVPECMYFKDIYPDHFRSNTMFKLGYQAFILFSIVSGYALVRILGSLGGWGRWGKRIFLVMLLPQVLLVSMYPVFSVRSYFGQLKTYEGIWGLGWLARQYPDNYAAIQWLNQTVNSQQSTVNGIIVEADGDSYTDYNQFSVFTGMPTVVGWAVHEWLWRGGYDAVSPRRDAVRLIYESDDMVKTRQYLKEYNVQYVVVGTQEREKFTSLLKWKFAELGTEVFRSGDTVIYHIDKNI